VTKKKGKKGKKVPSLVRSKKLAQDCGRGRSKRRMVEGARPGVTTGGCKAEKAKDFQSRRERGDVW